jgi:hypothetical protein
MTSFKRLKYLEEIRRKQKEERERLLKRTYTPRSTPVEQSEPVSVPESMPEPESKKVTELPQPSIIQQYGQANVPLYRDEDTIASSPSKALQQLVDLYLHAAKHRTRHIALVWPASLRSIILIHALATLERWAGGDKQGIRGIVFPVKSNAFHPLNHLHFDRQEILKHAKRLAELQETPNAFVTHPFRDKDAYLFSLASLKPEERELFNPTIGELLPLFFAATDFKEWQSCAHRLLIHIKAKLARRTQAKALQINCAVIGDPKTAPDAMFALDGRLEKESLKRALVALKAGKQPEVVLVNATRAIRLEGKGWKKALSRFCLMIEDVFPDSPPGVVVVTDEPHAAVGLKNALWELNNKRDQSKRWRTPKEYTISGVPFTVKQDGLLTAGSVESLIPSPRVFDVIVVDAEAAKVVNKLLRIANQVVGGREAAKPITDAAWYLSRMAALPCGVNHLIEWLCSAEVDQRTRTKFDWLSYIGAVREFDRNGGASDYRKLLLECIDTGSTLFERYQAATPFALRLAEVVSRVAGSKKKHVAVVFTNALYRRLAERFLSTYLDYPDGQKFGDFSDRVHLVAASQLEENFDRLTNAVIVFAGLDEECLRIVLCDDRVPPHSTLLLTQRGGQYLRSSLKPIAEHYPEFKPFKPRIESILRQLKDLPEDASVLSNSDFVLPTFKIELSSDSSNGSDDHDENAWKIVLESGQIMYRRPTYKAYVYDPSSAESTDRGFRPCEVRSLLAGDKLFVMSADLRELVEQVLKDAGIPIQHDKTFEGALRSYHEQVCKKLEERFSTGTLSDKVRLLRKAILDANPKLVADFPGDQAVRHWVNLGESENTPFEQLKPQAPMKEAHFKAFAEALRLTPLEAAYQWQRVIMAVRNTRRLDGRHVSDIYAYMLLQPESAMVHSTIKRQTLKMLFDKARESVVSVEAVIPKEGIIS